LLLIIVSVDWAIEASGTDKPSKRRWKANSFKANSVAGLISPDAAPAYVYNADTAEKVVADYYDYFKQHLLPVVRGEQWIQGLPKVNLYGN
jgi:hypothetical protein